MRVPVVLLTGFLGSGKTTLLNQLLARRQETGGQGRGKLAVLVNELGSVGIDASLLPPGRARQVELAGGCICCTLDENLAESLIELLDAEPAIDCVLIETTGIAEPLPIIWTLTGEALAGRIRLTAVVTVVDALEHERHRPLAPAVDNQVENADILVVSKRDALPREGADAALARLITDLRHKNSTAAVLRESSPEASASTLWQLLSDALADKALRRGVPAHKQERETSVHDEHARAEHHVETHELETGHSDAHGFEAVAVSIEGTLDFEELTNQLEALPAEYIRIKGICWAVELDGGLQEPTVIAFHRVGARVSAEPLADLPGREVIPRAVALGVGIDRDRLAACLRAAMVPCVG